MVLPASDNKNFIEPVQVARATAALLAAGAWDVAPIEIACAGFEWMTIFLEYDEDPAGANGAVSIRPEFSPYAADVGGGVNSWFNLPAFDMGAVATNVWTLSDVQQQDIEFGAIAAALEAVKLDPINIRGAERIRIPAQESGAVGNPGESRIVVVFSGAT